MNRAFLLALAFCVFTAAAASPALAEGKIGVASMAQVTAQSQPGQEAEKQLQTQFGKERGDLEAQAAALDKKAEDLNKQAAALSDKARADKAMEIQTQARDFEAKRADFAQRLNDVQQAITAQMQDILTKACINYGSQNGYDIIIDGAVIMYASDATNVTAGLVEEVNKVWKAQGGKFNLGGKAPAKK
ncbi:MAG: OmpH family outer membrane protein [Desulfovibrionaceae bacterium]|nr:OmpH family outer membrane protein [Desulfovibrionaceae bacterium]